MTFGRWGRVGGGEAPTGVTVCRGTGTLTLGTDLYEFLGCWCECIWLLGSAGYCLESVKSDLRDVSACYQVAGPSGAGYIRATESETQTSWGDRLGSVESRKESVLLQGASVWDIWERYRTYVS